MRAIHCRSGQALVEFALLATLMITLLLGIFDFGRAYYTQVQIKNAIGEAGYYAIEHPTATTAEIGTVIKRQLSNLDSSAFNIAVTCPSSSSKKIRATYQYSLIFTWIVPSAQVTLGDETYVPQLDSCTT
jgi:Flp pilus assembly protein TadG